MQPAVFITRPIFESVLTQIASQCEVKRNREDRTLSREELFAGLAGCQGVLCQLTDRMDREAMEHAPELRVIANIAVGYDNIDVASATERGILVTNTPEVLTETTADFAFALLLAAARRLVEADQFARSGQWKQWKLDMLLGTDAHHGTLGIIGLGRIGRAVARRARGFQMIVLYAGPRRASPEVEQELGARYVPLETLLRESDFVSLHVPLKPETRHLIGAPQLALMKPTAILINTTRGPVVDEAALVEALREGRIQGAGLDVFEREPEIHPGLLVLPNVVLAPHIGSGSRQTRLRMVELAAENLLAALSGQVPPNLVNRGGH
ncbi:MAG: D-glycerate dehydrogenase [Acidobacteria bacterium RIFCSPLOWO2_02_FULL_61_28]|nr:MAG: D-glycerate dehydrogenase [Acidobacteria bacterium RIFCSPLOWO2_02_FULL_61_28]